MTHKRLKEAPGTRAPEVRVSPYWLVASRAGFKGDRDRQLLSPTPHARASSGKPRPAGSVPPPEHSTLSYGTRRISRCPQGPDMLVCPAWVTVSSADQPEGNREAQTETEKPGTRERMVRAHWQHRSSKTVSGGGGSFSPH